MTHRGEEFALGQHRRFGGLLGFDQFALELAMDGQLLLQRIHLALLFTGFLRRFHQGMATHVERAPETGDAGDRQ